MNLTVDSPAIQEALAYWHEAGRATFTRSYQNLDYDSPAYRKIARDRNKYIALDHGDSGAFLVDKATGDVWTISAYGKRKDRIMSIAEFAAYWAGANSDNPYQLIYRRNRDRMLARMGQ